MALPICSLRRVPTASVVRGTKRQPVPKPDTIFGRTRQLIETCKVNRHKRKLEAAMQAKPNTVSRRESTLLAKAPTKKSAANEPIPRGQTLSPDLKAL